MHASPLLARVQDIRRQNCEKGTVFYSCGNFRGCCPVDPCAYMNEPSPCAAATRTSTSDGGDETTSTATQTSTPTTFIITTESIETSTSETEPTSSSSSATSSLTSSVEASTTTTLATSVNTSDLTSGATETVTAPASTSSSQASIENASLSRTAIAGVSIGGAVGGIALLLLAFWFIRRRRLSKRMSSLRGGSPMPPATPDEKSQRRSLMDAAPYPRSEDPFAEFGGAVRSRDGKRDSPRHTPKRPDEGWPLCAAPIPEEQPAQLDSQPAYVELDSTDNERPSPTTPCLDPSSAGSSVPKSPSTVSSANRLSHLNAKTHPTQLTPGFPGTQMAIQNRSSGSGDIQGRSQHDSEDPPRDTPRATLNATDDERMNNLYANSWASGP
ncbi:hypothetical protein F5Y10DRAFT_289412 [Nemania abortiva]|nr:hypothetical protein F5Y10DRAFT_289412 [Nemania abortiva]